MLSLKAIKDYIKFRKKYTLTKEEKETLNKSVKNLLKFSFMLNIMKFYITAIYENFLETLKGLLSVLKHLLFLLLYICLLLIFPVSYLLIILLSRSIVIDRILMSKKFS